MYHILNPSFLLEKIKFKSRLTPLAVENLYLMLEKIKSESRLVPLAEDLGINRDGFDNIVKNIQFSFDTIMKFIVLKMYFNFFMILCVVMIYTGLESTNTPWIVWAINMLTAVCFISYILVLHWFNHFGKRQIQELAQSKTFLGFVDILSALNDLEAFIGIKALIRHKGDLPILIDNEMEEIVVQARALIEHEAELCPENNHNYIKLRDSADLLNRISIRLGYNCRSFDDVLNSVYSV